MTVWRFVRLAALAAFASAPLPAFGYGEPDASGVPSREERFLLVLTNQVRQAPHEWEGWDTSLATGEARGPLGGLPSLATAARIHASDMAAKNFFSHSSSDGTTFGDRVGRYFDGPAGENIFRGNELDPYRAITAWMGSDGHRRNILDPEWSWLGAGYARAQPFHYYVQDFGASRAAAIPAIPAAASRLVPIGKIELVANYHDAGRKAAASMRAALGADCVDLPMVAGFDGNSTHRHEAAAPGACEPLVFFAVGADGELYRYPTKGAFLAGNGCRSDYDAAREALACEAGAGIERQVIDAEETGCRCIATPGGGRAAFTSLALLLLAASRSRGRPPFRRTV